MIPQPDDQTIRTLKDYYQHDKNCRSHSWNYVDGRQPCTCGLEAALRASSVAPDDQTILIDLSKWITCRFGLSEMSKMQQTGEAEQIYAEILRRIAGVAAVRASPVVLYAQILEDAACGDDPSDHQTWVNALLAGAAALRQQDTLTTFVAAHDPDVWEPARAAPSALRVEPATAVAQLQAEVRDAKAFVEAGCPASERVSEPDQAAPSAIQVEEGPIAQESIEAHRKALIMAINRHAQARIDQEADAYINLLELEVHQAITALIAAVSAAALRQTDDNNAPQETRR
jgi:hypothetical protein